MSKKGRSVSPAKQAQRRQATRANIHIGEVQARQLDELREELERRDGIRAGTSDLVRRCIAYAWRHARLNGWGPP